MFLCIYSMCLRVKKEFYQIVEIILTEILFNK